MGGFTWKHALAALSLLVRNQTKCRPMSGQFGESGKYFNLEDVTDRGSRPRH